MFGNKALAKRAKRAKKTTGRQYKQLQAILCEGPLELTVRSSTRTVTLTPSQHFLTEILGLLSEELWQHYQTLKADQQRTMLAHLEDKARQRG